MVGHHRHGGAGGQRPGGVFMGDTGRAGREFPLQGSCWRKAAASPSARRRMAGVLPGGLRLL